MRLVPFVLCSQLLTLCLLLHVTETAVGGTKWVIKADTASEEDRQLLKSISSLTFKHILREGLESCNRVAQQMEIYNAFDKDLNTLKELEKLDSKLEVELRNCANNKTCADCYKDLCYQQLNLECPRLEEPPTSFHKAKPMTLSMEFSKGRGKSMTREEIEEPKVDKNVQREVTGLFEDVIHDISMFEQMSEDVIESGSFYTIFDSAWDDLDKETKDSVENLKSMSFKKAGGFHGHLSDFDESFRHRFVSFISEGEELADYLNKDSWDDGVHEVWDDGYETAHDTVEVGANGMQKSVNFFDGVVDKALETAVEDHDDGIKIATNTLSRGSKVMSNGLGKVFKWKRDVSASEKEEFCQKYYDQGEFHFCAQFKTYPECVETCDEKNKNNPCEKSAELKIRLADHRNKIKEIEQKISEISHQIYENANWARALMTMRTQSELKDHEKVVINSIEVDPYKTDAVAPWFFNDVKVNFTVVQDKRNHGYKFAIGTTEATLEEPSNIFNLFSINSTLPLAKAVIDHMKKIVGQHPVNL